MDNNAGIILSSNATSVKYWHCPPHAVSWRLLWVCHVSRLWCKTKFVLCALPWWCERESERVCLKDLVSLWVCVLSAHMLLDNEYLIAFRALTHFKSQEVFILLSLLKHNGPSLHSWYYFTSNDIRAARYRKNMLYCFQIWWYRYFFRYNICLEKCYFY